MPIWLFLHKIAPGLKKSSLLLHYRQYIAHAWLISAFFNDRRAVYTSFTTASVCPPAWHVTSSPLHASSPCWTLLWTHLHVRRSPSPELTCPSKSKFFVCVLVVYLYFGYTSIYSGRIHMRRNYHDAYSWVSRFLFPHCHSLRVTLQPHVGGRVIVLLAYTKK